MGESVAGGSPKKQSVRVATALADTIMVGRSSFMRYLRSKMAGRCRRRSCIRSCDQDSSREREVYSIDRPSDNMIEELRMDRSNGEVPQGRETTGCT